MPLILPFPPKELNPNRKLHFRAKARFAAEYKQTCFIAAQKYFVQFPVIGNIHLFLKFYPPDNRPRDVDNLLASMKSGLDGISLAFGINDKRFRPVTLDMGDKQKIPFVEVDFAFPALTNRGESPTIKS